MKNYKREFFYQMLYGTFFVVVNTDFFFFFKVRWRLLVSHLGTQFMNKKMTTQSNFKDIFLIK
jgi:hypothetical protein